MALESPFGGLSHGLRIEIFATKKFFAESPPADRCRSPREGFWQESITADSRLLAR
jgi:hypothetical protein